MSRIAAVVYSSDNIHWTRMALEHLRRASPDIELVLIDNGSRVPYNVVDEGFLNPIADRIIRYDENIGGNAVFHRWMVDDWWGEDDVPEFLAFLHCDLMVHEQCWDKRVVEAFDADPKLSLIGFVGSNEIDNLGGRGIGTMLNYRGEHFSNGQSSPAEHHGRRMVGLEAAAVVDHCAMIFRTSVLAELTMQEGHYAPEHFYDRILSCEVIDRGEHIAVLGIDCDHFSGGIGDGMANANALRLRWLQAEGFDYSDHFEDSYSAVYKESERRFFARWSHLFPFYVAPDYTVIKR
jgi:hypothetical protein